MAADISQDPLTSLFKDGISEDLYKLLWSKDELNFGPNINIPDTIVYKYGQPTCWYFTAKNGRVKRKNKHNLMSAKIEEVFNKHVLGYDVLAYFITVPNDHDPNSNAQTTIEYLDRTALNEFLYNHKKEVNGFLQRFIEPKTTHNEIIRSIWSPKVCLLERAENIHQLHDHRYGLYERCVIYEGPEYYFTSAPLRGPVLSGQIQKLSETIVGHIGEVTFGQKQITRIVLNFKVDSRDKIWLLYSTSIRCQDMLEYTSAATSAAHRLDRTLVNIDSVISLSNNVSLNPIKSYEKIVPKARVRCLSCCKDTLEDQRHPVTYKSIVKHYDHVMHLLTTPTPTHGSFGGHADVRAKTPATTISWPPDKEIVEAAGGVGFALLYVDDDGEPLNAAKLEHLIRMKNVKDLQIPPMIHSMHSKLTAKSYQRCKSDPLFLYKTLNVCEPCYLVYAEFTSMLLRMGQDLTKLLTPDPFLATHSVSLQSSATRPSSADWRAISTANGSMTADSAMGGSRGFHPSANHRHAKSSAIGLRTNEGIRQPTVPEVIRNGSTEGELNKTYSYYSSGGTPGGLEDHSRMTRGSAGEQHPLEFGTSTISSANAGGLYNADEIKNMIADRERHFFKEISLNPQLKDQHPLMHLISAQQKLKLVDQQSGVLTSKAASQSESIFGTKYGKQKDDTFQKFSIYGQELPYAINGEIVLPSHYRAKKKEEQVAKKVARQKSLRSLLGKTDEDEGPAAESEDIQQAIQHAADNAKANQSSKPFVAKTAATATPGVIVDPKATQASQKHREFLTNALQHIEADLDNAQSYVGKYSGPSEEAPAPQAAVRVSGNIQSRRKGPVGGGLAPLGGRQSSSGSKLTLANMERSNTSNTLMSSASASEIPTPTPAPSTAPAAPTAAPVTSESAPKQATPSKSAKGTPTKKSAPSPAVAAAPASPSPVKPTKPTAGGSASKKSAPVTSPKGKPPQGKPSTKGPRVGSTLESSSLGANSTESALMQKWGIQVEGSVDTLTRAEEMRNIMESSNDLIDRKASTDDAGSVGERSTESETALLRQWGLDGGGSQVSQEVEMDKQRVQEESNSLLMGEGLVTPSLNGVDSAETGGGQRLNRDVIESMSSKLISAMLQDAKIRASSR